MIICMETARTSRANAQRVADVAAILRRLRAAMDVSRLSSSELAAASGIAKNTISNWFNRPNRPDLDQAAKIVAPLNITLHYLYLGDDRGLDWQVRDALDARMQALGDGAAKAPPRRRAGEPK